MESVLNQAETKEFIIHLNRHNQIFVKGEGVDGLIIGTYSPTTEAINKNRTFIVDGTAKQKKAGAPYLLIDSGRFFQSFKVIVNRDGFQLVADDTTGKHKGLEERFGELVGLSEQSKKELIEFVRPKLIQELRRLAS